MGGVGVYVTVAALEGIKWVSTVCIVATIKYYQYLVGVSPEPDSLDRIAQQMLVVLTDRGRLSTTTLREELGVDKNQRINYRGKRVLGAGQKPDDPALGLVANNGNGEGRQPVLEWWLTDRGEAYVSEHRDALTRPQTTSEAIDVSREALDTATEVEQRMQQLEGKFGGLRADVSDAVGTARETSKDVDETLADIEHTIDELVQTEIRQSVLELRGDCDMLIENQQELENRADSLESEVKAAATREEVDDWVGNIEELVVRNQGRLGKVESGQESHREEIEDLQKQVADHKSHREEIEELREQVGDQEQQLNAIKETLSELQETVEKGAFNGLLR